MESLPTNHQTTETQATNTGPNKKRRSGRRRNRASRAAADDLRVVAQVPLFESEFAYAFVPLPLAFDDARETEELRADVLSRCTASGQRGGGKSRGAMPPPKPAPTIRDLGTVKDDPWREGLRIKRLFPKIGGRTPNAVKKRAKRRAARKPPPVPRDERMWLSILAFFDTNADDIDCIMADMEPENDYSRLEATIIDAYIQKQIKHGMAMVQSTWTDTRREKARRGLTKEEIREAQKMFGCHVMADPDR